MLNTGDKSRHPCLVYDIRGKDVMVLVSRSAFSVSIEMIVSFMSFTLLIQCLL